MKSKRPTHSAKGPLPIADRNSELQTHSVNTVRRILPPEFFIVRREEEPDTGVDLSIELKERDGRHSFSTGEKANVQVKSCEKSGAGECSLLADKTTISYPVTTYNLNQLLNHHCPLYILYVHSNRFAYFAWARDEANRIEKAGIDWRSQEKVHIHFAQRLCRSTLKNLRQRIQQEAKLSRNFGEIVTKNLAKGRVTVHVNLHDQTVSDPDEIRLLLLKHGPSYVEEGNATEVLSLIDKLNPEDRNLAKIHLVRAFAEYARSRYSQAAGHISEAFQRVDELNERDSLFLELLNSATDYNMGRITAGEYLLKQKELSEKGDGDFALSRKIDYLRHTCLNEERDDKRRVQLAALRQAVEDATGGKSASMHLRVLASIALAQVEGRELARFFAFQMQKMALLQQMGSDPQRNATVDRMHARYLKWAQHMQNALQLAQASKVPHHYAEAVSIYVGCSYTLYISMALCPIDGAKLPFDNMRQNTLPALEKALSVFQNAENIEGVLRAKLQMARLYDLMGDPSKAVDLASQVLKPAKNYRFTDIHKEAESYASGESPLRKALNDVSNQEAETDFSTASVDDDVLAYRARRTKEMLELPEQCLPIIVREYTSVRDAAIERIQHCRHFDIRSTLTEFDGSAVEPLRFCVCIKHRMKSLLGTDWEALTAGFKAAYCDRCADRQPKPLDDRTFGPSA